MLLCARILAAGALSTALARLRVVPRVPVGVGQLTMLLLLVPRCPPPDRWRRRRRCRCPYCIRSSLLFLTLFEDVVHAIDNRAAAPAFCQIKTVAHVRPSRHNAASCCCCVWRALFDCQTALSVLVVAIQPILLLESVHLLRLSLNMFTSLQDARSASTNEKQSFATQTLPVRCGHTQSATVGM